MASQRVADVASDYGEVSSKPARDLEITRIKRESPRLRTGQLERNVDALLVAHGIALDASLDEAVRTLGGAARRRTKRFR